MKKDEIKKEIETLEIEMNSVDFWSNKEKAQETIKKIQELKDQLEGFGKYDKKNAIITIFSGAGGDDAEDFTGMLFKMYMKYSESNNWEMDILHEHKTDHDGYRNITFEILGKWSYGKLKMEAGVHRLVRLSPFNANSKRHTSFAMVEILPVIEKADVLNMEIKEDDLDISFARSSGPGGQSVNKRDTAVRIKHIPTNISVHVESERSQEGNREKAMNMIKGKLLKILEEQNKDKIEELKISKNTENKWGNQIRSYVLHPYKMVKDHRTGVEVNDVDKVLENGDIEPFIQAFQDDSMI